MTASLSHTDKAVALSIESVCLVSLIVLLAVLVLMIRDQRSGQ